jgi:hypothetical protein
MFSGDQGVLGVFTVQRLAAAVLGTLVLSCAVLVSPGASSGTGPGSSESGPSGRIATPASSIALAVTLDKKRVGTFVSRRAVSDSGKAHGKATVAGDRVHLVLTLRGRTGTLLILVRQRCGAPTGSWTTLSGTKAYAGLAGAGRSSGRWTCTHKTAYRAVLTGPVKLPPPGPLATAGLYRGSSTGLNLRVTLNVGSDGRSVSDLSVNQIVARCGSSRIVFLSPTFAGPYAISANKTVSIASGGYDIHLTFKKTSAIGTVTYAANGCTAAPLTWKVKNPPDPLPSVVHGRYCGFMLTGPGICLDVTSDAWVTNVHMSATVKCNDKQTFPLDYTYPGVVTIRPDKSFSLSLSAIPLDSGGSMGWNIAGTLDDTGKAQGTGGFTQISLVRDGARYTCRSTVTGWSAKLGA